MFEPEKYWASLQREMLGEMDSVEQADARIFFQSSAGKKLLQNTYKMSQHLAASMIISRLGTRAETYDASVMQGKIQGMSLALDHLINQLKEQDDG